MDDVGSRSGPARSSAPSSANSSEGPSTDDPVSFQYRPLAKDGRWIRVLSPRVLLGNTGQTTSWTIQDFDLDGHSSDQGYLALSYTWGCPYGDEERHRQRGTVIDWGSNSRALILHQMINGHATDGKALAIRPNLAHFLQETISSRLVSASSLIWIDAVCINQGDNVERGSQVKMMGEIYQHAKDVLIWLGPSNASIRRVANTLQAWDRPPSSQTHDRSLSRLITREPLFYDPASTFFMPKARRLWWYLSNGGYKRESGISRAKWIARIRERVRTPDRDFGRRDDMASLIADPFEAMQGINPETFRRSLKALAFRTYWRRVWIVQEVFLGNVVNIICGGCIFSFDTLFLAWIVFKALDEATADVDSKTAFTITQEMYRAETHDRSVMFHPGHADQKRWWSEPEVLESSYSDTMSSFMPAVHGERQEWLRMKDSGYDAYALIKQFGRLECSETRDKVYGFLGLQLASNPNRQLEVNYDENYSISELFFDTITFYAIGSADLEDTRALWASLKLHTADFVSCLPLERKRKWATNVKLESWGLMKFTDIFKHCSFNSSLGAELLPSTVEWSSTINNHYVYRISPSNILLFCPQTNPYRISHSAVIFDDELAGRYGIRDPLRTKYQSFDSACFSGVMINEPKPQGLTCRLDWAQFLNAVLAMPEKSSIPNAIMPFIERAAQNRTAA